MAATYDTDGVVVTLKDGATRLVNYDTGLHPWRNQYRMGPFNWVTDASLLKFFNVTEKVKVRDDRVVELDLKDRIETEERSISKSSTKPTT